MISIFILTVPESRRSASTVLRERGILERSIGFRRSDSDRVDKLKTSRPVCACAGGCFNDRGANRFSDRGPAETIVGPLVARTCRSVVGGGWHTIGNRVCSSGRLRCDGRDEPGPSGIGGGHAVLPLGHVVRALGQAGWNRANLLLSFSPPYGWGTRLAGAGDSAGAGLDDAK